MIIGLAAQSVPLLTWFRLVNDTVTSPYLDEVFHVRQAQHYCQGHFDIWDPKITTPPGLYLITVALSPILGCSVLALRGLSLVCLSGLYGLLCWTYGKRSHDAGDASLARHCALNLTLFPPLFFFSVLYYTDVASTLSVLLFYAYYLLAEGTSGSAGFHGLMLIVLGLCSLLFRQTNIFWIAIFPAGLSFVNQLDRGHDVVRGSMYRHAEGFSDSFLSVARTSWKLEAVYDPPVRDAWFEDYLKTVVALLVCSAKLVTRPRRLRALCERLAPFLVLICAFAVFIAWNGSVVLGDKSNHVATLHLPQMLYIWPYFAFFTWPFIFSFILALPLALLSKVRDIGSLQSMLMFQRRRLMPRTSIFLFFVLLACTIVHFNTIVHPFTLADNRHYTFYVFRLLMRPWWIKYAVTPIYVVCGWASIQVLGARPFEAASFARGIASTSGAASLSDDSKAVRPQTFPDGVASARTSFVLIWLATTSLQLITAPLVEPRYFILPWIFWRMHLPLQQTLKPYYNAKESKTLPWLSLDHRLWLETLWMLFVNIATGYVFLRWGFEWPQEPGHVQRFMW